MPLFEPCRCEARIRKLEKTLMDIASALEAGGGAHGSDAYGPTNSLQRAVRAIRDAHFELTI